MNAEVLSVTIDRGESGFFSPQLKAVIHVFEMTSDVDEKNYYILKNHVLVTLLFSKIVNLEINGFNFQNVLQEFLQQKSQNNMTKIVIIMIVAISIFGFQSSCNQRNAANDQVSEIFNVDSKVP